MILLVFGDPGAQLTMTGNAGIYLDKWILGDAHLYHGEGIAFDPEGFLSTIPAIVNVIIGYYAGKFIQEKGKGYETDIKADADWLPVYIHCHLLGFGLPDEQEIVDKFICVYHNRSRPGDYIVPAVCIGNQEMEQRQLGWFLYRRR